MLVLRHALTLPLSARWEVWRVRLLSGPLSVVSPEWPMNWYDVFALFYDLVVERDSRSHRQEATRQLRLEPGLTVLDVACGTGLNFPLLAQGIGSTGTIIGTDYSSGMLARAARKVARHGWSTARLLQADARTLTRERLDLPHGRIDRVLCTLGLSVMPDWESVFQRTFEMLEPGGRYAAMDLYIEPGRGPVSRALDFGYRVVARADHSRRFWLPLQQQCADYEERVFPFLGERVLVVSGTRPA